MPQLDPSTYASQIFWLVVLFAIFYLIVWKVAVPRISSVRESRQQKIDSDLDKAQSLREEAQSVQETYEKTLSEAASEAQAIHRQTTQAIADKRAEQQQALGSELAQQTRQAEERIGKEKAEALGNVSEVATEVVQASVDRLIGAKVSATDAQNAIQAERA